MFEKIKKLAVGKGATAVYVFEELEGQPSVVVRPATQANPEFLNEVLADARQLAKRKRKRGQGMSAKELDESRVRDLELYARHVVVRWEKPALMDDGSPAPDSALGEFLAALPDDVFDGLRAFCGDPESFRNREGDQDLLGN